MAASGSAQVIVNPIMREPNYPITHPERIGRWHGVVDGIGDNSGGGFTDILSFGAIDSMFGSNAMFTVEEINFQLPSVPGLVLIRLLPFERTTQDFNIECQRVYPNVIYPPYQAPVPWSNFMFRFARAGANSQIQLYSDTNTNGGHYYFWAMGWIVDERMV